MAALIALAGSDLRSIRRDPLLGLMAGIPPALILVIRLTGPRLIEWVGAAHSLDVAPHVPWALSALFLVNIPVVLFGGVFGLLLLDERDEGTLTALCVTPLGLLRYLGYRLAVAGCLSAVFVFVGLPLTGLMPPDSMIAVALAVLPTSILAAASALLLTVTAGNKVEGLAVMKVASFVLAVPLAAWFVDSPWTALLGVIPTFWPLMGFWEAVAGRTAWPFAVAGTVYAGGLVVWLLRRLRAGLSASGD